MNPPRYKALFLLDDSAFDRIYGEELAAEIGRRVQLITPHCNAQQAAERPEALREAELIFGGWGTPKMDASFLARVPNLKAVFYGAGTIRPLVSEAFWSRKITIVSAYGLNAIPVAEYALAMVILSLKQVWRYALGMQRTRSYLPATDSIPGGFRTTVGLISLGAIGRRMVALLRALEVRIIAYDPYCSAEDAAALGVELTTLEGVFSRSHVVSAHAPLSPETEGMVTGAHFAALPPGGAFINTARGAIVRESEMIEVLRSRPDLTAILDVTAPEPPEPDSPLFMLPNVILTPHIAGSIGIECRRLGLGMLDELERYLAGQPLKWTISQEQAARMA